MYNSYADVLENYMIEPAIENQLTSLNKESFISRASSLSNISEKIGNYVSNNKPVMGFRVFNNDINLYLKSIDRYIDLRKKEKKEDITDRYAFDFLENKNPKNLNICIGEYNIEFWFNWKYGSETPENYPRKHANEFERERKTYLSKLSNILNKCDNFDNIRDAGDWDNGLIMLKVRV